MPGDGGARETAAGINALEGYLLWQAETVRARERAERFAAGLGWLSAAERAEIERAYVRDQLDHAEDALRATAARCARLRTEYGDAYRRLAQRLTAAFLLVLGLVVGLAALLLAADGGT